MMVERGEERALLETAWSGLRKQYPFDLVSFFCRFEKERDKGQRRY